MRGVPDLMLVFPPFWDAGVPYLSVPTLAACLRGRGFGVETADLNLATFRRLLSPESLEAGLLSARRAATRRKTMQEDGFAANLDLCERVWTGAGAGLVQPFRADSPPPETLDDYQTFQRKLRWALSIASAPYFPLVLSVNGFQEGSLPETLSELCALAETEAIPGSDILRRFARQHAPRNIPVLGISVAGPSQLASALILAKHFKSLAPDTFVCVGGAQIPYLLDALRACPKPFRWIDAFVSGEGETPLLEICRASKLGSDPAAARGLHVLRGGETFFTGEAPEFDLASLPSPDFSDFEPPRYLGWNGSVCLTFSRGCSWRKCAFCTQHLCFGGYREMSEGQVAAHMADVVARLPVKVISVNDENLTPKRLRQFASIFRGVAPGVRWQGLARLTPQLADRNLTRELADSGCRMLALGLESASQQVLNLVRKGIPVRRVSEIVSSLQESGIWVHLFLIFGLPGETRETALETIRFVQEHLERFDSISPTTFRLERGSAIAEDPERFGVRKLPTPADHFGSEIPFATERWLPREEALIFFDLLISLLVGARQCPVEQADLNGQYLIELLAAHGAAKVRQWMEERADKTWAARQLLTDDDGLFRLWSSGRAGRQLAQAAPEGFQLLELPDKGLFALVNQAGRTLFKLRSMGLTLESIKALGGRLGGESRDPAESDWQIDGFVLAFLVTRFIQETLDLAAPNHRDAAPEPTAIPAAAGPAMMD